MSKLGGGSKSSGASDAAAQRAADEEERQAQIAQGLESINTAFGGFNDDFYNQRSRAYLDYYQPQLQQQFGDAQNNLVASLARAGLLKSTAANQAQADLTRQLTEQQGALQNRAAQTAADLQQQIAGERNALVNQLNVTADPDIASSAALASSQALQSDVPTYSPLSTVITPLAIGGANYLEGRNQSAGRRAGQNALRATDPRNVGKVTTVRS